MTEIADAMNRQFGPDWRAGPPLAEAEVERFEAEHGIRLPEAYRTFVLTEANGAVGPPDFGLVPLGAPSDITEGHAVRPGSLATPFPLTETWIWEDDASVVPDDPRVAAVHTNGFLPLGTDGCAMDWVLVTSGPARGQVWILDGVGAEPVARDFAAWLVGDVLPGAEWTLESRADHAARPRPVEPPPRSALSRILAKLTGRTNL